MRTKRWQLPNKEHALTKINNIQQKPNVDSLPSLDPVYIGGYYIKKKTPPTISVADRIYPRNRSKPVSLLRVIADEQSDSFMPRSQ